MAFYCPHCKTVILSRRNRLCSTCRTPLPVEVLFTAVELEQVEAEERQRELSRKLEQERRSIEAAKRLRDYGGD